MSKVTLPAETARQMAESALGDARRHEDNNRPLTAVSRRRAVSEALDKAEGKDGEFIALRKEDAQSLVSASSTSRVTGELYDSSDYYDGGLSLLEHFGVW